MGVAPYVPGLDRTITAALEKAIRKLLHEFFAVHSLRIGLFLEALHKTLRDGVVPLHLSATGDDLNWHFGTRNKFLPKDVATLVLPFLDPRDRARAACVSRSFYHSSRPHPVLVADDLLEELLSKVSFACPRAGIARSGHSAT